MADFEMPKVDEVLEKLIAVRDDAQSNPGCTDPDCTNAECRSVDVRLHVKRDGTWFVRSGDAQYDTDHHGVWAASSVMDYDTDETLRATARDLIEDACGARADVSESESD